MNPEAIPSPNTKFDLKQIDGELLLYQPAKTKAVYLNETETLVWQLRDSSRLVEQRPFRAAALATPCSLPCISLPGHA